MQFEYLAFLHAPVTFDLYIVNYDSNKAVKQVIYSALHLADNYGMIMTSKKALLIIDLQNDYFPKGKYPLHNTAQILSNIGIAIDKATQQNIPIILIQHIADAAKGIAPFFNAGSLGVQIHPAILNAAASADIVEKRYADSFEQTNLEQVLQRHKITELLITGMMTQNCVTHTAISKAAEKYDVLIMEDCCTTVDEMLHKIALNAVATRVKLQTAEQALA